jgi:hypothetical protein
VTEAPRRASGPLHFANFPNYIDPGIIDEFEERYNPGFRS